MAITKYEGLSPGDLFSHPQKGFAVFVRWAGASDGTGPVGIFKMLSTSEEVEIPVDDLETWGIVVAT